MEVAVARRPDAVEVLGVGVVEAGRVVGPRGLGGRDLREPEVRIAEEKHVRTPRIGGPVKAEDLHGRDAFRIATESQGGGPSTRHPARLRKAAARHSSWRAGRGRRSRAGRMPSCGAGTRWPFLDEADRTQPIKHAVPAAPDGCRRRMPQGSDGVAGHRLPRAVLLCGLQDVRIGLKIFLCLLGIAALVGVVGWRSTVRTTRCGARSSTSGATPSRSWWGRSTC